MQSFKEPLRSLQPPIRNCGFASEYSVIPIQRQCDAGSAHPIRALVIRAVRFFTSLENARSIVKKKQAIARPSNASGLWDALTANWKESRFPRSFGKRITTKGNRRSGH
jgi:hypothetical protein